MRIFLLVYFALLLVSARAQKMVLLERANRARSEKFYTGDILKFRLDGKGEYWYEREITDILPESQLVLLDNQPTPLNQIVRMKLRKGGFVRACGGALVTFGVTMVIANTVSYLRKDGDPTGLLYATAAASGASGYFLLKPRNIKMGKKYRLRAVEVPLIPGFQRGR